MEEEQGSSIRNDSTGDVLCPVCGDETVHHCPAPDWGEMRRCLSCGMVFANPMSLLEDSTSLFNKAYQGRVSVSNMQQFAVRLKLRDDLKALSVATQSWGKDLALDWLKANIPPASAVLDIGCGTGLFLSELRRAGFQPLGLDVAQETLDILRDEGYQVWLGNVGDIPGDWPEPAACTCFYVLHHLPDPVGFLRDIRQRFPNTPLLMTETAKPPWRISRRTTGFPPRTLTRWTAQTLRIALERAGYTVPTIFSPPKQHSELGIPGLQKSYLALRHILPLRLLLPYYFKVKRVLFAPWVAIYRLKRARSYDLAIGMPAPHAEEK